MTNNLYFLLPCYNEEENIATVIEKINKNLEDYFKLYNINNTIIVIDDGSIDKTAQIVEDLKSKYNNIILLKHITNKGLGEALKTGIMYILQNNNQNYNNSYICIMDADNSHEPNIVMEMYKKIKQLQYDCIIASRYQKGSEIKGVPFYRNFLSFAAKNIYKLFLPIESVNDYTSGFRIYKLSAFKDAFEKFNDNFITESGFSCMVEILYKLHITGSKFEEYPIVLKYDQKKGKSKMKILKNILNSFKLIYKLKLIKN